MLWNWEAASSTKWRVWDEKFCSRKENSRMKILRNRKQGNYFLLRRSMLRESSNVLLWKMLNLWVPLLLVISSFQYYYHIN